MLFKRLDILPNSVQIDDDILERPPYISVSDWEWFWDSAKFGSYNEGYRDGYKEGKGDEDDE